MALAGFLTAVAVVGGQPHQCSDLPSIEGSQLRHVGQQPGNGHRSHTFDGAQLRCLLRINYLGSLIPLLTANKVDLVLANFTITPERAEQVDFSIPYFSSGQQFIVRKGSLKSPEDLNKWRVGVDKGTVNEGVLRDKFPGAKVIAYDDTPFAFTALRNGQVQAITQDGPKLIGLLANVPDKDKYEVPPFTISNDLIGVGIPKGEKALAEFVNQSLTELEAGGQAQTI